MLRLRPSSDSSSDLVLAATTVERPVAEVSAGFVLLLLRSAASLSAAVVRRASRPFLGSLGKEAAAGAGGRKVLTFSRSRIRSESREFRVRGWMVAGRRPVRLMQFPHRPGSQEWQQAVASPQLALREHSQHTVRRCLDRLENRVGESAVSASLGLSPSRDHDRLQSIVAGESEPALRWSIRSVHALTKFRRATDSWERSMASSMLGGGILFQILRACAQLQHLLLGGRLSADPLCIPP